MSDSPGSEDGHTPGPWTHYDDSAASVHRHDIVAKGKTVARVYCTQGDELEDAANARLIAAAPEMLEALQGIEHFSDVVAHRQDPLATAHG